MRATRPYKWAAILVTTFGRTKGRVTRGFVLLHRKCMVFYIASEKNVGTNSI